jgi:ribonuclease HI
LEPQPEDYENDDSQVIQVDGPDEIPFNTRITVEGTIGDTFRIFTSGLKGGTAAPDTRMEPEPDEEMITVYTDGSALHNGTANVRAGSGIFYDEGDARNTVLRVPDELGPSNQVGEVIAVKDAAEKNPKDVPIKILSDSKYTIDGLTKNLQRWEDEGFFNVVNGAIIKATVARFRARKAPTVFQWVKGHSRVAGNEGADKLAGEGAEKDTQDVIDTHIEQALLIPGAKLQKMTQSLAYKIIRGQKLDEPAYQEALDRTATARNMAFAQGAAASEDGSTPSVRQIWQSTKIKTYREISVSSCGCLSTMGTKSDVTGIILPASRTGDSATTAEL